MRGRRWIGAVAGVVVVLLATGAAVPAGANPRPAPGATWRATKAAQMPATGDVLFLDGADGDYLTSGRDHLFLGAEVPFAVTLGGVSPERLRVTDADGQFRLSITPPDGAALTTGFYGAIRKGSSSDPAAGELDLGIRGNGCNLLAGWYQIDELDVVGGAPQHIALRFGVRCERYMPTTYGQLRWSSPASAPNVAPPATVTASSTADGIRAEWTPSTSAGVSGYEVIATRDGLAVARQLVDGGSTTTATITGLSLGRRHQVVVRTRLEGAVGPRSRSSNSVVAGFVAADPRAVALVEQLYRDVLGRRPDPAGRDYWVDRLQSGASRSSVTLALVRTPEQRRRAVERLVYGLTARAATPDQVDALAPWLVAPNGYDQISALVVGTEQRLGDYDRSPDSWADGLHRDVLGRPPDPDAERDIMVAVADGASLPGLALPVIQHPDARRRVVEDIYVRLLGRPADAAGRFHWELQLRAGRSPELVTAALIASPEYAARAAAS